MGEREVRQLDEKKSDFREKIQAGLPLTNLILLLYD